MQVKVYNMEFYQVEKIIDRRIQKHQKYLDENYGVGDENEDIGFHNSIINILNMIKKEVRLYGMVENFNNPYDAIDLLKEVNLDDDFAKLMMELLRED